MTALWIEVVSTRGSAPRDSGTAMKVTATGTRGTIGGGRLEYVAIATARAMLASGRTSHSETLPLGPNLGQCCGGSVTLRYTDTPLQTDGIAATVWRGTTAPDVPVPLWVWGAGHVGRAVIGAAPPKHFAITWVDTGRDRFPPKVAGHVTSIPTADMPRLAPHAPADAHHLIFTYSHDIDLKLCAALLRHGGASIGLIGSRTKWARFRKRLTDMGLDPAPITCPIGDKSLGKMPAQIARGTIAALLARTKPKADA